MNMRLQRRGEIYTFVGGVLWGISGTLGAYLFTRKAITPNWLVPYRLLLAGIFMLVYLYLKEKNKVFSIWKDKKDILQVVIFGIFGMLGTQYSYFVTISYSNAGVATVLQYLGPTLILMFMCFREKRIPQKYELTALILSVLGIFILATHGDIGSLKISLGALFWGLLSAFAVVVYTVQPANILKKYGTVTVNGWGMIIGGILIFFIAKPWNEVGTYDITTFIVLLLIVVFGTILTFSLYLAGVAIIGPTKGSMISCIEPVSATFFSAFFLGTAFSFLDLVGFVFILSTVFIVAYFGAAKEKKKELR